MQFACAYARLAKPYRLHQLHYGMRLMCQILLSLATLVKRLTAHAYVVASLLYAQSLDFTTTDSLPARFFTLTPCSSRMMSITFSNRADFNFSSLSWRSSSLMRCSGVSGLLGLLAIVALRLPGPLGWDQSCKPCLRHHTKTVERPCIPYRFCACLYVISPFSICSTTLNLKARL